MNAKKVRVGQAAELAGQSVSTIRRWCDQGLVRCVRINGQRLIDVQSLSDLLDGGDGTRMVSHQQAKRTRAIGWAVRAQMRERRW